jgi:hypothetical protein
MLMMHHKDEMCSKVNKVNKANMEETRPAVVYVCKQNVEPIHLRYQMVQPYLLE